MKSKEELLTIARQRGQQNNLPYAGAVTPSEAFALLQAHPSVKLVDVRTNAERDWVGRVQVPADQHLAVQWSLYPGGVPNPEFVQQLTAQAKPDDVLLFLCRSGVRSRGAAKLATENGYPNSFDIQVRDVTAETTFANRFALPPIVIHPNQWLPAGKATLVHVPTTLPWLMIPGILAETIFAPVVPFSVRGSANVTATQPAISARSTVLPRPPAGAVIIAVIKIPPLNRG